MILCGDLKKIICKGAYIPVVGVEEAHLVGVRLA
jgi:hypothetical protein